MSSAPRSEAAASDARTPWAEYERAVRVYTEAGAAETVQRIVVALSRLSRHLDVFYRARYEALDIAAYEWPVLQALAMEGRDGVSNPSRLADAAGVPASTMTHRLDRMVARGLIERAPDPENRTRMSVSLTRAGWELFRAAVLDAEAEETDVFAPLTDDERTTLATLLEKAVAGQAGEHRSDEGAGRPASGARRQPAGEHRSDEGARSGARRQSAAEHSQRPRSDTHGS